MQTLVLRIPDDLAKELDAEPKKAYLKKSEVARRRLIADLVGTVERGPADMSARKKEYLKSTSCGEFRHC